MKEEHINLMLPMTIKTNMNTACKHLRKARKQLKEVEKNAATIREAFLEEHAQFLAQCQNKTCANIIKQIKNAEASQKIFKRI